jgi:hypothetical protein
MEGESFVVSVFRRIGLRFNRSSVPGSLQQRYGHRIGGPSILGRCDR